MYVYVVIGPVKPGHNNTRQSRRTQCTHTRTKKKNEEGTGMNLDLIFYYEYFESNFMSTDTRISLHAILLKDERNRNIRGE